MASKVGIVPLSNAAIYPYKNRIKRKHKNWSDYCDVIASHEFGKPEKLHAFWNAQRLHQLQECEDN